MRIGISVLTHDGQNIWENGLGQNVLFLARLFRSLPFVDDVVLLNCGDQASLPPQAESEAAEFPLVPVREATHLVDVAIEMAGALDTEWLDYMRALGKSVVFQRCGLAYVSMTEPNVFGREGGYGGRPDRCDEVWILPMDRVFIPMVRSLHRCPVFEVPYIWAPTFLDRSIAVCEAHDLRFGFQAPKGRQKRGLRAAIFEPNISVVKASSIPMLICDEAYRRDRKAVPEMKVLNSLHMVNHVTFNYLANSLDITKDGKALFLGREEFPAFMAQHADMVVSHQWQNAQNYVYLDALYGGYPLIHNSPWIADQGYYYPDFNIDVGADQIVNAYNTHVENLDTYNAKARRFIASLDPMASANRDNYARRLLHLRSGPKAGAAA